MIDKDGNIRPKETKFKKWYSVIKGNTAQIAITIPIVMAICAYVINLFSYILERGHYGYFEIEASFMLYDNKTNIYQLTFVIALMILYWLYTIFAVRMFILKRNIVWKIVCFFLAPVGINIVIGYRIYGINTSFLTLALAGVILIIPHWYMIFALGYCMVMPFYPKGEVKEGNKKKEREGKWNEIHYKLLGCLMILLGVILLFCWGYWARLKYASAQRRFGIVNINEVTYAVIDANENKLILQECEIDEMTLKINKNTYLCVSNEVLINFQTFNDVKVEQK